MANYEKEEKNTDILGLEFLECGSPDGCLAVQISVGG